jgi:hypothetical protein
MPVLFDAGLFDPVLFDTGDGSASEVVVQVAADDVVVDVGADDDVIEVVP